MKYDFTFFKHRLGCQLMLVFINNITNILQFRSLRFNILPPLTENHSRICRRHRLHVCTRSFSVIRLWTYYGLIIINSKPNRICIAQGLFLFYNNTGRGPKNEEWQYIYLKMLMNSLRTIIKGGGSSRRRCVRADNDKSSIENLTSKTE